MQTAIEALQKYAVKLEAGFARIRIEYRARGDSAEEQFKNMLPESVRRRESLADGMPKYVIKNMIKAKELHIPEAENALAPFERDANYSDVWVVPAAQSVALRQSELVQDDYVMFIDKVAVATAKYIRSLVKSHQISKRSDILVSHPRSVAFLVYMAQEHRGNIIAVVETAKKAQELQLILDQCGVQSRLC